MAGRSFIDDVDRELRLTHEWLFWIDDNHENHVLPRQQQPDNSGMAPITERILYLPRGHRWEWSGVRFRAPGVRARSTGFQRVPGESWWPEEAVLEADVERLGQQPLDGLLTHDAPEGVPLENGFRVDAHTEAMRRESRLRLGEAVTSTRPRLLLQRPLAPPPQLRLGRVDTATSEMVRGASDVVTSGMVRRWPVSG